LPESLTFDVTALEMGHALHIAEVKFPEGVTPTTGAKVVIALIAVLASLVMVASASVRAKGSTAKCIANLRHRPSYR
jgi:large subunit ribosomal protein L25